MLCASSAGRLRQCQGRWLLDPSQACAMGTALTLMHLVMATALIRPGAKGTQITVGACFYMAALPSLACLQGLCDFAAPMARENSLQPCACLTLLSRQPATGPAPAHLAFGASIRLHALFVGMSPWPGRLLRVSTSPRAAGVHFEGPETLLTHHHIGTSTTLRQLQVKQPGPPSFIPHPVVMPSMPPAFPSRCWACHSA